MSQEESQSFYITTTLPYVNARPHIGFATEIVRADALARFHRLLGKKVFFNTGTDEHGQKIAEKAAEEGIEPQAYTDKMSAHFEEMAHLLNISHDRFIRTTDHDHTEAAKTFWDICKNNGYIYKKKYKGLYCVGDEMFLKDKDLVNGKCPNHPNQDLVEIEEENYFFAFSKFGDQLKTYLEKEHAVVPAYRAKEMLQMIDDGLEDFSISRLKEKVSWGIPVPGDDEQVMYVWFDALVNYISTLGWPKDMNQFNRFWIQAQTVQICGKDNTQHQALRWQAMLLAAGIATTDTIIVNGFLTSDGQKMSKSLGNVVDPTDIVNEFGTDGLRYFTLREFHPHEDSDVTHDKLTEAYNANLANGIGNLTNRIMKMAEDNLESKPSLPKLYYEDYSNYFESMQSFNLQHAADTVWEKVSEIDTRIQETQPFKLVKEDKAKAQEIISELVQELAVVAFLLQPLLPETAQKMALSIDKMKKPAEPLFQRI